MSLIAGFITEDSVLICGDMRAMLNGAVFSENYQKIYKFNQSILFGVAGNQEIACAIFFNMYDKDESSKEKLMVLKKDVPVDNISYDDLIDLIMLNGSHLVKLNCLKDKELQLIIGSIEGNHPRICTITVNSSGISKTDCDKFARAGHLLGKLTFDEMVDYTCSSPDKFLDGFQAILQVVAKKAQSVNSKCFYQVISKSAEILPNNIPTT